MSKFRINKTKDYTILSNHHLRNKELSLKAKGLLSVMLGLPEDWNYSISGLVSISKENESAIKSTLDELKENGYLVITKLYPNETDSGRYEYVYDIYEEPNLEKQEGKKQGVEFLGVEFLGVENMGLNKDTNILNTNILNTKEYNNKNIKKTDFELEFDKLWSIYPNKKGKSKAFQHYKKARKTYSYEQIETGLQAYIFYIKEKKIDMQYVKNGSTWFNQECWNDDYTVTKKSELSREEQGYAF